MRRTERRLYDTMRNTDSIFQHKLDYVIDYCVHRQIVKILLSFVTHHLWSVHHLQQISIPITLIFVYLNDVWRIRLAQIRIHIHALSDLLGELRGLIANATSNKKHFDRHIYTNIWKLKKLIGPECR